jgi:ribonuclease HI
MASRIPATEWSAAADFRAPLSIYAEGACKGMQGPGAWAAILVQGANSTVLSGSSEATTAPRIELISAVESLSFLPLGVAVDFTTSSAYLRDGITRWIRGWKESGWRTNAGMAVKNADLWKRLDILCDARTVRWADSANSPFSDEANDLAMKGIPVKAGSTVSDLPAAANSRVDLATFLHRLDPSQQITVATDGASSGNPGPAGWGAVLAQGSYKTELNGGEVMSTNNRMELMAAIRAIAAVPKGSTIVLTTDSTYVRDGVTKWISAWKRNGWKTADKKPVKNQDLWMELDQLNQTCSITWEWVKGHNGHPMNERADRLAVAGMPK